MRLDVDFNPAEPTFRYAVAGDYRQLVTGECDVYVGGSLVAAYRTLVSGYTKPLLEAFRVAERNHYVSYDGLWRKVSLPPDLTRYGREGSNLGPDVLSHPLLYRAVALLHYYAPQVPALQQTTVGINRPVPYHCDASPMRKHWSSLAVAKNGDCRMPLVLPQLGLAFEMADDSVLVFESGLSHANLPPEGAGLRVAVVQVYGPVE